MAENLFSGVDLQAYYSNLYLSDKHDCPYGSPVSMITRVKNLAVCPDFSAPHRFLDIGAGRQALIKQLLTDSPLCQKTFADWKITTVDFSQLSSWQLLAAKYDSTTHFQADGAHLPFPDRHFGLVISHHAIDFMPRSAFVEARRVLDPKGSAVFYFHHPNLYRQAELRDQETRQFFKTLKDNDWLFDSPERIITNMKHYGFRVQETSLNHDKHDQWWEVVLH